MRMVGIIFAAIVVSIVMPVFSYADDVYFVADNSGKPKQVIPETVQTVKPQKPKYQLRKEPMTVSDKDVMKVFKLKLNENDYRILLEYIQNEFKNNGDGTTITDHATDLMWQKSGSPDYMSYEKAKVYIEELNRYKFAGFNDWQLPTVDELTSLLTSQKQSNGLYINPIFDYKHNSYWTSDKPFASRGVGRQFRLRLR